VGNFKVSGKVCYYVELCGVFSSSTDYSSLLPVATCTVRSFRASFV